MTGIPFFFFGLTGIFVAIVLARKSMAASRLQRKLTIGAVVPSGIVGTLVLFVFFTQNFSMPGPGIVIVPMTMLSVIFWVASLIWAGPATSEDRLVFTGTVILTFLMFISAALFG
ncbi:MAG: hypothetical protein P8L32_04690 [Paracoccaceae bacterium]|jgi:hypothetical protein|nr:hypothetical protein [Paracoccaceae bacterium]